VASASATGTRLKGGSLAGDVDGQSATQAGKAKPLSAGFRYKADRLEKEIQQDLQALDAVGIAAKRVNLTDPLESAGPEFT
jgi:hypothetical protein